MADNKQQAQLATFSDELQRSWQRLLLNLAGFFKLWLFNFLVSLAGLLISSILLLIPLLTIGIDKLSSLSSPDQLFSLIPLWSCVWVGVVLLTSFTLASLFMLVMRASFVLIANNYQEQTQSLMTTVKQALKSVPNLILLSLINFFFFGSFWFFIIPWIFIIFFLTFAQYEVILAGKTAWQAIKNSFKLFSQFKGVVFTRLFFLGLIIMIISLIYQTLMVKNGSGSAMALMLIGKMVLQALISWFTLVFGVILYHDVKASHDPKKKNSIWWAIVFSLFGWLMLSLTIFAGISVLKQNFQGKNVSNLTHQIMQRMSNDSHSISPFIQE